MANEKPNNKRKYKGVQASMRRRERREKLLAAGLEAFGTTGYARSSIKAICDLAGLTERYFYESFGNKEELLKWVYQGVVDQLLKDASLVLDQADKKPAQLIREALKVHYGALRDDPRKARILYFEILGVSPEIDRVYQAATNRLKDMAFLALMAAFPGLDKKALEKSIIPTGLAGAVNLIVVNWVLEDFSTPLEDILSQAGSLVEVLDEVLKS